MYSLEKNKLCGEEWSCEITKFSTLKTKVNELDNKIPDSSTLTYINQYNIDKESLEKNSEYLLIKSW